MGATESPRAQVYAEVPRYRLVDRAFLPFDSEGNCKIFEPGTIFESMDMPGPHCEALNEAAEAKFEEWYNQDAIALNERGEKSGTYKPHEGHRRVKYEPAPVHMARIVANPPTPKEIDAQASLASMAVRNPTDPRPGPLLTPGAPKPTPRVISEPPPSGPKVSV